MALRDVGANGPFPVKTGKTWVYKTTLLRNAAERLGLFAWAFQTRDELAAINRFDRTGLRLVKGGGDFLSMRPDHRPVDRGHNEHRKRTAFKPLLFIHILVAGQKNVEAVALDQRQQRAVLDAAPLHADDGMNLMLGEGTRQLAWYVLVKQDLQGCA